MRWYWIDRFTEFVSGRHAVAIKVVTTAEDHLFNYYPGFPVMPASLIVEGLAQTGGLLVGEHGGFLERVVLAKVGKAVFHDLATPGDMVHYRTEIVDINEGGAFVTGAAHVDGRPLAEVELFFAHLDDRDVDHELFEPVDFLVMLRLFRLFEVGRTPDGVPIEIPPHLLSAEQAANAREGSK